ncbi:MAG TPA: twin-arginine translocase TatA/TatE family subunit [Acidimicrobiales bacterium]|nr:twin-arginine translocase TatA/TatE family subunit [Acidimicrobiales bacterium]
MFSLSPIKILVVVAVILVLLGPDKLPEVANRLGRSWRALRRLQERVEAEVRSAVPDLPSSAEIARIARSPVNLLNQLADRAAANDGPDDVVPEAPRDADPLAPAAPDPGPVELSAPTPRAEPPPPADERPFADPSLN